MVDKIALDSHTKWIVAVVSAGIVGILGTFLMLDRGHIALTATMGDTRSIQNEQRVIVLEQRTDVRLKNIEGDVAEIKLMMRELQRKQER